MSEPDDRLERAWRSLAREEPPGSLDARILAAAHRAVARPFAARRWGVPVSLAALLVLAVGVTLEMQHEEPGIETSAPGERASVPTEAAPAPQAQPSAQSPSQLQPSAAPPSQAQSRPQPGTRAEPAPRAPQKPLAAKRAPPANPNEARHEEAPQANAPVASEAPARQSSPAQTAPSARGEAPAPAATAPAPSPSTLAMPHAEQRLAAPAATLAKRPTAAGADATAAADPRVELERIARLREEGRDAQADRALDEFRKRHPDYRIDDAMWQRVKPR